MLNSTSPFYMKPRFNIDFFRWVWYFNKSATAINVKKAIPLIREINLISKQLYKDIYNSDDLGVFHIDTKGVLMLYKTDKAGEEEFKVSILAAKEGLDVKQLSFLEVKKIEPTLHNTVKGAILYECDAHLTPNEFIEKMIIYLRAKGVIFKTKETVTDFITENDHEVKGVQTDKTIYTADEFVIASGSWSRDIAKKLNLKLPMEAGKGYGINVTRPIEINYPAILMEPKVAVTPMNGFTRFAGTMEFSGINTTIRKERVNAIVNAAKQYYEGLTFTTTEIDAVQSGLRPISPDGLPYIGKTKRYKNITIASGHAMMGWSLGPITGKLVAEIITNKKLSMNIDAFNPDRKF